MIHYNTGHRAPSLRYAALGHQLCPVTLLQGPGAKPELHGDRGDSGRHPGVLLVTGAGTEKMGPQALSVNQAGCVYQSLRLFCSSKCRKVNSQKRKQQAKEMRMGGQWGTKWCLQTGAEVPDASKAKE